MQIGNLDLKTRFSWLFVLIKMNFLQKWPKEKRNCPVLKFHAWNMGIILIFHYSDISYNTGPHREYQCNASVSVFFLTSTYNAHPYPNTCLSTPRWRYCVPKINTQLSSWAEFHCSPTKSLADANLLEYVDTHSLLTGYLRPWELDICSVVALYLTGRRHVTNDARQDAVAVTNDARDGTQKMTQQWRYNSWLTERRYAGTVWRWVVQRGHTRVFANLGIEAWNKFWRNFVLYITCLSIVKPIIRSPQPRDSQRRIRHHPSNHENREIQKVEIHFFPQK